MPRKKYTVVSLFTGAMGLDIGLERTGRFKTIACVEKVHSFCETIRLNRDKGRLGDRRMKVFEADISTFDPADMLAELRLEPGDVDLVAGGPPCQSFSTAGRRGTVCDPRGTLIWQFLRFVVAMQPKFFLMENVRGLLSAALRHRPIKERPDKGGPPLQPDEEPGSVVRLYTEDFSKSGPAPYRIDCFEVNAVNYGSPQLRERVLFIGNRFNRLVHFPSPTHGHAEEPPEGERQQLLFDPAEDDGPIPFGTLGDAIQGLHEEAPVIMDFSPRKKRYLSMVPPGGNWRSLPEDVQRESMGGAWHAKGGRSGWWRRLSYDLPCPTVLTMPNHASSSLCHPEEVRALTVRECALVQEFPPDWEFVGSAQEQYAQVGNAVPVRLGQVAGEVIARELDDLRKGGCQVEGGDHPVFRLEYIRSHVRTRRWYKAGRAYVWRDGKENSKAEYGKSVTQRKERQL